MWHCCYHIVWTPKYRYRVLKGEIKTEVEHCFRMFSDQKGCEIIEMNVQVDHVHLLLQVPPKVSISDLMGVLKGRTAIRVFNKFKYLKQLPYWGNLFWSKGDCVDPFKGYLKATSFGCGFFTNSCNTSIPHPSVSVPNRFNMYSSISAIRLSTI